jgi:hypothetical protein
MAAPTTLPVIDRTKIEYATDITFCNSPIHLRLQNEDSDNSIESAFVYLWIWNGEQDADLASPNHTLYKSKVSVSDDYLNFEISELIKSFLISPLNAPNTNQPNFSYNELDNPAITGQGVFWQIVADITSDGITTRFNYRTSFATLGYRYNSEQTFTNVYNVELPETNRWYNPRIHNYINQTFNLTRTVAAATTANIIVMHEIAPPTLWERESRDPYLIVYLNKLGLWDMFTPHGKATETSKKEMATNNVNYRDPSRIDNSYVHSKLTDNFDVTDTITINTGSLTEDMVENVRQILYSPKVYLIKFAGDFQETTTVGITIDSNYVTIDSLNTTIDGKTVTEEFLGYYKTHQQIPVILTDTDFTTKNRVNDKNQIDYNLKFEVTTNKINDIR